MSSTAEAFDLHAEDYDAWFESPKGKALFKAEADAVRALMNNMEPPFLEIGVGSGRFAEALGIAYGIDPSARLIEKARARGINARLGRGEDLPYEDNRFGGVFVLFTLCFVDEPERVIAEAKRVLKPGGALIAGIVNRLSTWGLLYSKKKADGHPLYSHAALFASAEVVDMMKKAGMSVEAFSSTLVRPPSEKPREEIVVNRLQEGAGFICILARKGS